jgi:iron(III) transport system substrate-binding protein
MHGLGSFAALLESLKYGALLPALLLLAACGTAGEPTENDTPVHMEQEVNVYSHRHYATDEQLFKLFTERTGIKVNVVQAGDDELMARLEAEGAKSPADLLITADAGRLGLATLRGLIRSVSSGTLEQNIPAHFRDPEGHWFGLTMRARVFAFNKEKVDPDHLATYADLTRPEWKGRVLVRSSENVYNQSLVAAMIERHGPQAAEEWCKGIVANLARDPKGGDTDQLLALAEGIGDVAISNSYYIGKIMAGTEPERQRAREVLGVVFPRMHGYGTHVNVSGGGVTRHAPHPENAIKLLEFLSSDEAQAHFADGNKEYPVKKGVPVPKELQAFGEFTPDTLNLAVLARNNSQAVKIMTAAGWR